MKTAEDYLIIITLKEFSFKDYFIIITHKEIFFKDCFTTAAIIKISTVESSSSLVTLKNHSTIITFTFLMLEDFFFFFKDCYTAAAVEFLNAVKVLILSDTIIYKSALN